jgi:hypothetical protein
MVRLVVVVCGWKHLSVSIRLGKTTITELLLCQQKNILVMIYAASSLGYMMQMPKAKTKKGRIQIKRLSLRIPMMRKRPKSCTLIQAAVRQRRHDSPASGGTPAGEGRIREFEGGQQRW